jgi:hypothetical protein
MTQRELLTKFLDYIYYISDKSTQYTAISAFLEEGKYPEMNWTTEYPTKPGYYWIRKYFIANTAYSSRVGSGPDIVEMEDDLDYIFWTGDPLGVRRNDLISAEWFGPITPPEGEK